MYKQPDLLNCELYNLKIYLNCKTLLTYCRKCILLFLGINANFFDSCVFLFILISYKTGGGGVCFFSTVDHSQKFATATA